MVGVTKFSGPTINGVVILAYLNSLINPCLYMLFDGDALVGLCVWHVDDCLTTGSGPVYEPARRLFVVLSRSESDRPRRGSSVAP